MLHRQTHSDRWRGPVSLPASEVDCVCVCARARTCVRVCVCVCVCGHLPEELYDGGYDPWNPFSNVSSRNLWQIFLEPAPSPLPEWGRSSDYHWFYFACYSVHWNTLPDILLKEMSLRPPRSPIGQHHPRQRQYRRRFLANFFFPCVPCLKV